MGNFDPRSRWIVAGWNTKNFAGVVDGKGVISQFTENGAKNFWS
jgi:hypothetical protein